MCYLGQRHNRRVGNISADLRNGQTCTSNGREMLVKVHVTPAQLPMILEVSIAVYMGES